MKKVLIVLGIMALSAGAMAGVEVSAKSSDRHAPDEQGRVGLATRSRSGFRPPVPSDVMFVTTSAPDLGIEWGKGKTIRIPLLIERFYGNWVDRAATLPKTAQLNLIVHDVDSKYDGPTYEPECDKVSVNGHYIGTLYGDDEIWESDMFEVPVNLLNFKENADDPTPENYIEIEVDSNKDGWVTTVEWAALGLAAPPPVVLAHGINTSKDSLEKLRSLIRNEGLLVESVSFYKNGNNDISEFSELAEVIWDVQQNYHVEQVNIVAHSMGGLRSRGYVECSRSVMKVLQIATPNAGSPIADFMMKWKDDAIARINDKYNAKEIDQREAERQKGAMQTAMTKFSKERLHQEIDPWNDPAVFCLQTSEMATYNEHHPLNSQVEYGVVAGCIQGVIPGLANFAVSIALPFLETQMGEEEFNRLIDNLLDVEDTSSAEYMREYLKEKLADLVRELCENSDGVVMVESAHTMVPPLNGSPLRGGFSEVWHSGLLDAGVNRTFATIRDKLLEPKEPVFYSNMCDVNFNTRRLARRRVQSRSDVGRTCRMKSGLLSGGVAERFEFDVLKGNRTIVSLTVDGDDASSAALSLVSPSGTRYTDSAKGVVMFKESGSCAVMLLAPEKGRWGIEMATPSSSGSCIWMGLAAEKDNGIMFKPSLRSRAVKAGSSFVLTVEPKLDSDPVKGVVAVQAIAADDVVVRLEANDRGLYPDAVANDGVYSVAIPASTVGSYRFMTSIEASSPLVFSHTCELTGVAYSSSSSFNGVPTASAIDEDGNGLYDALKVSFPVLVEKAASCRVMATLSDDAGNDFLEAWSEIVPCAAGTHSLDVLFNGRDIFDHGDCGGYKVSSVRLVEIGTGYEADVASQTDVLNIGSYGYSQFEHPLIVVSGRSSENAVDSDGDGVFDRIDVQVPVSIDDMVVGGYEWSANLFDGDGNKIETASGSGYLDSSAGSFIALSFGTEGIAESNKDGPYRIGSLIIWGNGQYLKLDLDFQTRAYKAVQFGGLGHTDLAFAPDEERGDDDGFGLCDADGKPLKSFVQGETVYLYANFRNAMAGEGLDDRFQVAFAWSEEDAVTETCPGLEADEVGKILIPAPGAFRALPPGRYTLTCTLDSGEDYAESDEKNNVGEMSFSVTARGLVRPGTVRPFTTDAGKDYAIRSAVTYGGYLLDAKKKLIGVIDVKLSKPSKIGECAVSGSVTVLGGKKTPLKMPRGTKGTSTGKIDMTAGAETIALEITADTIGGRMGKNTITGVRTDSAAALNAFNNRVYTLALETQKASGSAAPLAAGYSGLSLVVGKKGKVKVSGVIGDGTKVATTAQLLPGDGLSCLPILAQLYTKKAGGFGFLVWFEDNGTITLEGLSDWDAESSKFPFTATFSANVPVCERTDIPGSAFFGIEGNGIQSVGGLPVFTTLLPTKVPVANTGKKWNVEKADKVKLVGTEVQIGRNPAGVTLSYDKKTGAFKGKFSVYADKQGKLKKNAAAVNGVVVDGKGYGTAVIKNTGSMPVTVGKRK